ncbi:alpha/beta hydrolase [Nocardia tengchongensis]|uniref:alpha/beta fold hydrolase n=1 Tax=Nocardia tengchongensis TaxID=2055889 RepID=UPI0033C0C8FB
MAADQNPPVIPGVRRSFVEARGVRFHVTEAGEGEPVLALHGWPQHHYTYRDLLGNPPAGMRVIAPDLPGYGWSGAARHQWAKEDVATDLLALMDVLGLDGKTLLVGHDWGGWVGFRMIMREPERFRGYLVCNMAHPWSPPGVVARQAWRILAYQPLMATVGVPLQRRTRFLEALFSAAAKGETRFDRETIAIFADRFKDPLVARTARDTYRTFLLKEIPASVRNPERRRVSVPVRALFGKDDAAVHYSLAAEETARADDYTLEMVEGCGHFVVDERPELVRARLIELADQTR